MENTGTYSTPTQDRPWMNTSLSPDERVNLLLPHMILEEKVAMLSEQSGTSPSRLGIPTLTFTDGPSGVRIDRRRRDVNEGKSTAPPTTIGLAATWNLQVAQQYGELMGLEAWSTGHNVLFGPGLDIARIPFFGRMFEALGEDPLLTGQMAAHYIGGVQRHAVVATAKHYNVNAQEEHRHTVDALLDERTLQEIYTLPFALAVQDGHVGSVMGAYNILNGTYCCENPHTLTEILKQQLGFSGWVISDFEATPSTVEAANAGLDMELGFPPAKYFGTSLLSAVHAGQVSEAYIDEKVSRILRTMFTFGLFDSPPQITPLPVEEHGQLAYSIATQSIVLLKNANAMLPLASSQLRSIALIGADADSYIAGGGSGFVLPTYLVSIREGIQRRVGEGVREGVREGVQVEYAEGTDPVSPADILPGPPLVPSSVLTPSGADSQQHGLYAEYWTNPRFEGEPQLVRIDRQAALNLGFFNFQWMNASSLPATPDDFNNVMSVRWTGNLMVPTNGNYTLSLTHLGTARLFFNNELLIDEGDITLETQSVTRALVVGQSYPLRIEYAADRPEQAGPGFSLIGAQIRFGWEHPAEAISPAIQEAAALARKADVAVVVVRDYRAEHGDLPSLTLSNEQDLLVQTVAAANPRTIVVVASGGPVLMPWLDSVPAVLETWYGGQELGNALASILFGDVSPSGKLPITFPRTDHDTPVSSPEQYSRTSLLAHFSEGLAVGYRGYDQFGIEPLFPFGYGLSYTSFEYSQLEVAPTMSDGSTPLQVSFTLKNIGERTGAEIAQVYLQMPESTNEPPKRLVGWVRVELKSNERRKVTLTLEPNASSRPLSYWNISTHGWDIANGDYQVYVGASSRDIRLNASLTIKL